MERKPAKTCLIVMLRRKESERKKKVLRTWFSKFHKIRPISEEMNTMAVLVVEFSSRGTKLEILLHNNQGNY